MPFVFANGRKFNFEEQGSGPALVLLSGLGGDSRAFSVMARRSLAAIGRLHSTTATSGRATEPIRFTPPPTWLKTSASG